METSLSISSAPAAEPLSTEEAKLHLRITHDEEDDYIDTLITSSRQWAENVTNRALITQSWRLKLSCFPNKVILLPKAPLASVSSITYIDTAGTTQTLSSSVYLVDAAQEPGTVRLAYGQSWPAIRSQHNAITVTFSCGYGAAGSSVPASIRQAMLAVLATSYEFREDVTSGTISKVPEAAERLIWPYRTWLEYEWR